MVRKFFIVGLIVTLVALSWSPVRAGVLAEFGQQVNTVSHLAATTVANGWQSLWQMLLSRFYAWLPFATPAPLVELNPPVTETETGLIGRAPPPVETIEPPVPVESAPLAIEPPVVAPVEPVLPPSPPVVVEVPKPAPSSPPAVSQPATIVFNTIGIPRDEFEARLTALATGLTRQTDGLLRSIENSNSGGGGSSNGSSGSDSDPWIISGSDISFNDGDVTIGSGDLTLTAGDLNLTAGGITLGGVYRTTWPSAGGDGVWATSSLVTYPDLSPGYAVVIGNTATSSNVRFEVNGDTKLGGNLTLGSLTGVLVGSSGAITASATSSLGLLTTDVAEGTNQYFTNARVASYISGSSTVPHVGGSAYGDTMYWTGSAWATVATSSLGFLTTNVAEGTNQYFTNARARGAVSETVTGLDYDNSTGVFSLASGYSIPLSASTTNWNDFYDTPSTRISTGAGLSWSGNTLINTGGSGSSAGSFWATSTNSLVGYPSLGTGYAIVVGATATSSNVRFEVNGDTKLGGNLTLGSLTGVLVGSSGAITASATSSLGLLTTDVAEGTNQYFTNARARGAVSETVTGLDYDNSTGVFSLASGYSIPLSASTTNWNGFYDTPSTRITAGTGLSWSGNTLNNTAASPWTTNGSNIYYTTGNVGIGTTTPGAQLNINKDSIGTTQSDAYGILLENTTAAAAGAQQMSPGIVLSGNGWKTNATAASQNVRWRMDVLPVQRTTGSTGTLQFAYSNNGSAYTNALTLDSTGGIVFGLISTFNAAIIGGNIQSSVPTAGIAVGGNQTFSTADNRGLVASGTWTQTSGTNYPVSITPTYNQASGTASNTDLLIQRTETAVGSGSQYLIKAGTSALPSLFVLDNQGRVGVATSTPGALLNINKDSIGVTQSDANGILLENTTAAANGAQQQSPGIVLSGNGWKTNATAASQNVRYRLDVLPVQGNAAPTGTLQFAYSINGAAYANAFSVNSSNGLTVTAATINTIAPSATAGLGLGRGTTFAVASQTNVDVAGTWTQTSGTNSPLKVDPTYNQASGTAANTDLLIQRTETAVGSGTQYLIQAGTSTATTMFVVTNAGKVGINQSAPAYRLHVGSTGDADASVLLRLQDANSTCDFTADSGAPSCGSDRTLKQDIVTLDGNLNKVLSLRPVSYRWRSDPANGPIHYGFIAQEVEEVMPELVTESQWIDGTTKKFLSMGGMVPYLVGAVKDLAGVLEIQTQSDGTLRSLKLDDIEARLAALEQAQASTNLLSRVTTWVGEKLTVDHLRVNKGLELTDEVTGEIYCVAIKDGRWSKRRGDCSQTTTAEPVDDHQPPPIETVERQTTPDLAQPISTSTTPILNLAATLAATSTPVAASTTTPSAPPTEASPESVVTTEVSPAEEITTVPEPNQASPTGTDSSVDKTPSTDTVEPVATP